MKTTHGIEPFPILGMIGRREPDLKRTKVIFWICFAVGTLALLLLLWCPVARGDGGRDRFLVGIYDANLTSGAPSEAIGPTWTTSSDSLSSEQYVKWEYDNEQLETKQKGGDTMFNYELGFGFSVFFFGAITLIAIIYFGGKAAKQWVNDEDVCVEIVEDIEITHPIQALVALFIGVVIVGTFSLLWPIVYPIMVIAGILFGVRMVKRFRKAISRKADIDHTH